MYSTGRVYQQRGSFICYFFFCASLMWNFVRHEQMRRYKHYRNDKRVCVWFRLPRRKQLAEDEVASEPRVAVHHVSQTNATRDWFSASTFQRQPVGGTATPAAFGVGQSHATPEHAAGQAQPQQRAKSTTAQNSHVESKYEKHFDRI